MFNTKESRVGKQESTDWQDTKRDMTFQRGPGGGCGSSRGRVVRGSTRFLQKDVKQPVAGSTKSSEHDPFVQEGFL